MLNLQLYFFWFWWVSSRSALFAAVISIFCAVLVYVSKGFMSLDKEVLNALLQIVYFCFPIAFSFTFIISFLLVFKALFKHNFKGFNIELYNCAHELIKDPQLSDVTSLWRKWLFVTLWVILVFLVLFFGVMKIFFEIEPLSLLNGISAYTLVSIFGGLIFVFGVKRCKKIGIKYI